MGEPPVVNADLIMRDQVSTNKSAVMPAVRQYRLAVLPSNQKEVCYV